MTTADDLKTMASHTLADKYRMIVENTSRDVIQTALRMYPNAIVVDTQMAIYWRFQSRKKILKNGLDF